MSHARQPSSDTFVIEDDRISDESLDDEANEEQSPLQQNEDTHEQDMRWRLTAEEKASVRELKEAADAEGLYYKNIFELAKYVLVVQSIADKTEAKYCDVALRRLRKRHAWLQQNDNLQDVDAVEAHQEINQDDVCPHHFDQRFVRDREHQRTVVTTHMAHVPLSYIQQRDGGKNKRRYLAAVMYRMDLGVVDMEEARRGMVLATISEGQLTLGRAWKYMRFMNSISADMKDMHPHTVKAVHAQFPSIVAHMLPAVKHVLPRKVADRIHVYGSVEQMAKHLETVDEDEKDGKATTLTPVEWARRRRQLYDETVAKLSLD